MKNTIYWFSGTGNSLYVAKMLSNEIGETELVQITSQNSVAEAVGGSNCKIGFVFPSYYGNLPRLVYSFVESLNILPDTDIFAIVTMGAFGQGSVKAIETLLTSKGQSLRYGIGVRINGNYILNYDPAIFGAKSEKRIDAKLNKADKKVQQIAADIKSGKHQVKKNPITAKTLYTDIISLDSSFSVNETCTSCGLCERVCPADNIKLTDDKPVWQHHCEHCVACISWCPTAAINYGEATKKHTRYHNPRVKVTELEKTAY